MSAAKKPLAQWYESLLDSVVKEREPASRSYRYLSRLIEREYPKKDAGLVLAFCSPDGDKLSCNVMLMQAYCLQSELDKTVLIMDARVRSEGDGLSQRLGLTGHAGYAELLHDGPQQVDALIQGTAVPKVSVLPVGGLSGQPVVVQREHLAALLTHVKSRFDYILMQLGSVVADTRNLVIATHADAVVLLAHENKTLMRTLNASEQLLQSNGVSDVRVVIASSDS